MCEKYDLLTKLREIKSIKCSTIDSLISNGFDSSETLLSLDFDKDLPQLNGISLGQKSLLRKHLSELKAIVYANITSGDICVNHQSDQQNCSTLSSSDCTDEESVNTSLDQSKESLVKLKQQLSIKDILLNKYKEELDLKYLEINRLNVLLKQTQTDSLKANKTIKKFKNQIHQQFSVHTNSLKNIKNILINNQNLINERHFDNDYDSAQDLPYIDMNDNQHRNEFHSTIIENNDEYESTQESNVNFDYYSGIKTNQLMDNVFHSLRNIISDKVENTSNIETNTNDRTESSDYPSIDCHQNSDGLESEVVSILCEPDINLVKIEKKAKIYKFRPKSGPFKCDIIECQKKFKTRECLTRHVSTVHNMEKPFECYYQMCDKKFTRKETLIRHLNLSHGIEISLLKAIKKLDRNSIIYRPNVQSSDQSNNTSTNNSNKRKITKKSMKSKKYKCTQTDCTVSFTDLSNMKRHLRNIHSIENRTKTKSIDYNIRPFECKRNGCNIAFRVRRALRIHVNRFHNYNHKQSISQTISKQTSTQNHDQNNLVQNLGNDGTDSKPDSDVKPKVNSIYSFICQHFGCDKGFKSYSQLKDHLTKFHSKQTFKCTYDDCQQSFNRKDLLGFHLWKHENDIQLFECNINSCQKKFLSSDEYNEHKNIHCDEQLFYCEHYGCQQKSQSFYGLKEHKKLIHENQVKSIKCPFDDQLFNNKVKLELHVFRFHKDVNLYQLMSQKQ